MEQGTAARQSAPQPPHRHNNSNHQPNPLPHDIDALNRIHEAEENSITEMKPILAFLYDLSREFSVTVMVVHHHSKSREGGSSRGGQRMRGTSDIHGRSEGSIYCTPHNDGILIFTDSLINFNSLFNFGFLPAQDL